MADTSNLDAGLLATLKSDSTLGTYATDGVFWDEAPAGATRKVIVSQVDHEDRHTLNKVTGYETVLYAVTFVGAGASDSESQAKSGAARIHALLENTRFTATGYSVRDCKRVERIRFTERVEGQDAQQPIRYWQHRGGVYEVMAEATA